MENQRENPRNLPEDSVAKSILKAFQIMVGTSAFVVSLVFLSVAQAVYRNLDSAYAGRHLLTAIISLACIGGVAGAMMGLFIAPIGLKLFGIRGKLYRRWSISGTVALSVGLVALLFVFVLVPDGLSRRDNPIADIPEGEKPPNVILIVVDSLRQDVLERTDLGPLAPHLTRLASEASAYSACQAVCSWTRPSMAGMLTGHYPTALGAHAGNLPDDAITLAECLHEAGYETVGISDNYLTSPAFGFAQGHEFYWQKNASIIMNDLWFRTRVPDRYFKWWDREFHLLYEGAGTVNQYVRSWLSQRNRNRAFYLMVHYMDVHYPFYVYSDEPGNLSNRSTPETFVPYYKMLALVEQSPKPPFANLALPSKQIDDFCNRYYGSIQHLDRYVGALLQFIKDEGEWENTLLIITSDHGEEFFEHGCFSHGRSLYQESIHVPLLIKWPHQRSSEGQRISEPVSSLQIMPTVLAAAGITREELTDLQPPLTRNDAESGRVVFSEFLRSGVMIYAAQETRFKHIYSKTTDGRELFELYDLDEDPEETKNRWKTSGTLPELEERLREFISDLNRKKAPVLPKLSSDQIEKLRGLGYTE